MVALEMRYCRSFGGILRGVTRGAAPRMVAKNFSKKLVIPLFRSSQLAIIFETRSSAVTSLGAFDIEDTICGACHQPDPRIGGPFNVCPSW